MKEEAAGQSEGSAAIRLSADAAEFVPNHDCNSLPKYMFNCYPFVTESVGQQSKSNGGTPSHHQQHSSQGLPHKSLPSNHHHCSSGSKHHGHQPIFQVPPPNFYPSHSATAGLYGQVPASHGMFHPGFYPPRCPNPGDMATLQAYSHPPYLQTHSLGYPMSGPRARPPRPLRPPRPSHPQNIAPPHFGPAHGGNINRHSDVQHRKHQKQGSSSDRRPKISVGTQNEFGSKHTNTKSGNVSTRSLTKTIMLMDTAAQTDFASEIADHTLEQVPNALYQGKRKLRRKTFPSRQQHNGGTDSTDSEELDHSDSGYSSPMHRQNQISSGTDAQTKTVDSHSSGVSVGAVTTATHYVTTPPLSVVTVSQVNSCTQLRQASSVYHAAPLYSEHINPNLRKSYALSASLHRPAIVTVPHLHTKMPQTTGSLAQTKDSALSEQEDELEEAHPSGKKRKRKRGRRRRRKDKTSAEDGTGGKVGIVENLEIHNQSPILSQETPFNLLSPDRIAENFPSFAEAGLYDDSSECKLSGKRKKRREQANKAAMEEQLEIDLEQQALKVVNQTPVIVKPAPLLVSPPAASGKKSQQPVSINLMDFIASPSSKTPQSDTETPAPVQKKNSFSPKSTAALNPLDSSAPNQKRGKERETPKAKKPSALKKVILKEREERKRMRYIGDGPVDLISTPDSSLHFTSEPEENDEDDVISDIETNLLGNSSIGDDSGTPHSQDLSPVSQNSPISVGLLSPPTSLSNPASGIGSPTVVSDIIQKIHSRRFREYCKQVLDKEIDANCTNLLQTLVKFQDRLYHKDPIKAKTKRRLVLGLREVTKHLKLRRVKLVIISPNLEKIQSKGGLDDALNIIINLCSEQDVPFVFALGRRSLGRACAKLVPVSVVGVFNYQGAETMYKELIELTSQAREAYHEMVDALAKELAEYGGALKGSCGLYFSHLGHSRTPSGCSAISFTSSILSEPVSDVQSVKAEHIITSYSKTATTTSIQSEQASSQGSMPTSGSSSVNETRGPLQDDIYDIDEGNEADTEDNDTVNHNHATQTAQDEANAQGNDISALNVANNTETSAKSYINNNDKNGEAVSFQEESTKSIDTVSQSLAQISLKKRSHDSHRRTNSGSHFEIRSQASSRTLDHHDTVSCHSSVTIENASETELVSEPLGSSSSSSHLDRIKSWVRDVDTKSTLPTEISQDDVEFNATYTACEANTDVLISRSRSPSISKS